LISVIRPEDDAVSERVGRWWEELEPSFPNKIPVKHARRKPGRSAVESAMRGAKLVIYLGHGTAKSLVGPKKVSLVDRKNVREAGGAIVVAIACLSADQLADAAVGKGVRAYIGFTGLLPVLPGDDTSFRKAALAGTRVLLQGKSADAAVKEMQKEFRKIKDALKPRMQQDPESLMSFIYAKWYLETVCAKGDLRARILW